ncbi:MAG: hypothetical protein ABIH48_02930 [Candidatus Falkowbacteria bacterium]
MAESKETKPKPVEEIKPKTIEEVKPGYKKSEFWLTLVYQVYVWAIAVPDEGMPIPLKIGIMIVAMALLIFWVYKRDKIYSGIDKKKDNEKLNSILETLFDKISALINSNETSEENSEKESEEASEETDI